MSVAARWRIVFFPSFNGERRRPVLAMRNVEVFPEALDGILAFGRDKEAREVELAIVVVVRVGAIVMPIVVVHDRDAPAVHPVHVRPRIVFDARGRERGHAVSVAVACSPPPTLLAVFAAQGTSTATRSTLPDTGRGA